MELLLIVLVILLLFGGIGTWPSFGYHHYGYGPSGLLLVLVVIILIVFLLRRRRNLRRDWSWARSSLSLWWSWFSRSLGSSRYFGAGATDHRVGRGMTLPSCRN